MRRKWICRYCGGIVRLIPASKVFRESTERLSMEKEFVYQCQNCNARVGCHKGTTRPLGNVANEVLRLKRMEAHHVFDQLWLTKRFSRTQAYKWLAEQMNMEINKTHIGGFEMDECERAVELCTKELNKEVEK